MLFLLSLVCLLNSESLQILREHRARDLQNKQKHIRYCINVEIIHTSNFRLMELLKQNQGIISVTLKEDRNFIYPCRWRTFAEGGLRCIDTSNVQALGPNFIFTRQRYNLAYIYKCDVFQISLLWTDYSASFQLALAYSGG